MDIKSIDLQHVTTTTFCLRTTQTVSQLFVCHNQAQTGVRTVTDGGRMEQVEYRKRNLLSVKSISIFRLRAAATSRLESLCTAMLTLKSQSTLSSSTSAMHQVRKTARMVNSQQLFVLHLLLRTGLVHKVRVY